jgi:hypothetical protein
MNCKGCGKKWPWPILRHIKDCGKPQIYFVRIAGFQSDI